MKSFFTSLLLVFSISLISQNAFIQVEAEPGISIFLDNTFKGKTSSEIGGLIIENVSGGVHSIKVLKEGFNPQEERITVRAGEVYTYRVRPFVPKLKITESGNTGQQKIEIEVGKLKIQSLPVSIKIIIPSLGINYSKSKDEWKVDEVPVGTYSVSFNGMNKTLTYKIEILNNQLTHLFVNMVKGEIEDRSQHSGKYSSNAGQDSENHNLSYGALRDNRDRKTYKTISIGSQVWMAENLSYWPSSGSWVYNNDNSNEAIYGRLYDWKTANRVCPSGWHLPNTTEWTQLIDYLGGASVAGGKLKEKGLDHWENPNKGATNETGFSGRPGGCYCGDGAFYKIGLHGSWWSASESSTEAATFYTVHEDRIVLRRSNNKKYYGLSVRCVKD